MSTACFLFPQKGLSHQETYVCLDWQEKSLWALGVEGKQPWQRESVFPCESCSTSCLGQLRVRSRMGAPCVFQYCLSHGPSLLLPGLRRGSVLQTLQLCQVQWEDLTHGWSESHLTHHVPWCCARTSASLRTVWRWVSGSLLGAVEWAAGFSDPHSHTHHQSC